MFITNPIHDQVFTRDDDIKFKYDDTKKVWKREKTEMIEKDIEGTTGDVSSLWVGTKAEYDNLNSYKITGLYFVKD